VAAAAAPATRNGHRPGDDERESRSVEREALGQQ
jgi:hypothetical protein